MTLACMRAETRDEEMSLHTDGYEVLRGAFTITEEQREAIIERGKRGKFIFNHNKQLGVREDRKRKQISLGNNTVPEFKAAITYMLQQHHPKLKPTNMVVLHSKAGCQQQNPHCDYEQPNGGEAFATTEDELIPLGKFSLPFFSSQIRKTNAKRRLRHCRDGRIHPR